MWYLVDGQTNKSLGTKVKRYAQALLDQYNRGKYGIGPKITVGEYYARWIETKKPPIIRVSLARDYRQHFTAYILPEFSHLQISNVSLIVLDHFRKSLLMSGLSVKTCRNLIDASFRAMWRDAMAEGLVTNNPFALLRWPRMPGHKPDPFTADERDRILAWFEAEDFFFYPYVFFQFHTGLRPSETAGLTWPDVNLETGSLMIRRSLVMGDEGATKTKGAERIISIGQRTIDLLRCLPSRSLGIKHIFVGKRGNSMSKKWAEHNWASPLRDLGIRHRKFYCTRHTFITECIKRNENILAVAQHCGTSVAMIQRDYAGGLGLSVLEPLAEKTQGNQVAGPGFEPLPVKFNDLPERLTSELLKYGKKAINQ